MTRNLQQLPEAGEQKCFLTRRQPLYPRLPLASSLLHQQQPHAQWINPVDMTNKGHSNIQDCSGAVYLTTNLNSHNNLRFSFFFNRHDERRGFQAISWRIHKFNHYVL